MARRGAMDLQQIAFLIITIFAHVHGIQNGGAATGASRSSDAGGGFRPSTLIAVAAPSPDARQRPLALTLPLPLSPQGGQGAAANYANWPASVQLRSGSGFAFPSEPPFRPERPASSRPILTYHDPSAAGIEHQYRPPPAIHTAHTLHMAQRQQPQAYTVQSSLLVGNGGGGGGSDAERRPGYVFDEPRPVQPQRAGGKPAAHRLSYDSHDYPPPSYYQPSTPSTPSAPSAQRQDAHYFGPSPTPPPRPPPWAQQAPASSNYASHFGNYLLGEQLPQAQPPRPLHRPPAPVPGRPGARPPAHYFAYQTGELPPPPSAGGSFGSLGSLLAATPQLASMLLGSLTGGGGGGSPAAPPTPSTPARPANTQLVKALENIARNDDLQCVPKVLCQMIAGQAQRGPLPALLTSPALNNFLAGLPASSPALIYGRAVLLGLSGGESSCARTYELCPKDEYEILHYLNNHRGGFFKFFSEPEQDGATPRPTHGPSGGGGGGGGTGAGTWLSVLSALAAPAVHTTTTTPRPRPRPTPGGDITAGIASFFTRALAEYLNGVEYQRRRRSIDTPPGEAAGEDFYDAEDYDDAETGEEIEPRILHREEPEEPGEAAFFPAEGTLNALDDTLHADDTLAHKIAHFNVLKSMRKLKFPSDAEGETSPEAAAEAAFDGGDYHSHKVRFDDEEPHDGEREGKQIVFPHDASHARPTRSGRILNRPVQGFTFDDHWQAAAIEADRFVVSDSHRGQTIQYPGTVSTHTQPQRFQYSRTQYEQASGTRRPLSYTRATSRPTPREDDHNVYVTNGQGVTEYLITPDGRKVYL